MIYFVTQTGTPWEKKGELRTETAIGKNIHLIKSYYVYFVALISCESTSISWIQISGFVPDTVLCTEHCVCVCKLLFQLCLTLWPHGLYLPGSYVHEILQARILECVAMASFKGSFWPRDWTCASYVSYISRRVLYH